MAEFNLEKQIGIIVQDLGKIFNRLDDIDERFDHIEARLDNIEKTQEEHGQLLSQLVASQKKQDHLLEILTVRSVDQEVEIKMIKEAM
mgnify:CR=1 FL=1